MSWTGKKSTHISTSRTDLIPLEQRQLAVFAGKIVQVCKAVVRAAHNPVFFASGRKNLHKVFVVGTIAFVAVAELLFVAGAETGKVLVQCVVKVFAITLAEREPEAEADDTFHTS